MKFLQRQLRRGVLGILAGAVCLGPLSAAAEPEKESVPGQLPSRSVVDRDDAPKFTLHGFADIGFIGLETDRPGLANTSENYFSIGELDLYIVSAISPNITFLGELVFELDSEDKFAVDIERLFLRYSLSDRLWLSIGRRHTPLGYWNQKFHHGRLLEPTVDRPSALKFEDDNGILPVHNVGVSAGGRIFRNTWSLDYEGGLSNGRGLSHENVQGANDLNTQKAGYLRLAVARSGQGHRFQFGPMLYRDRIPADATIAGREDPLGENIFGFHFYVGCDSWELLSEYYDIRHDNSIAGVDYNHDSYYAIATLRSWDWKPYFGFDKRNIDSGDPFYADLEEEFTRYLTGVRWDNGPFQAFKFEYRHDKLDAEGTTVDSLALQAAFTF